MCDNYKLVLQNVTSMNTIMLWQMKYIYYHITVSIVGQNGGKKRNFKNIQINVLTIIEWSMNELYIAQL